VTDAEWAALEPLLRLLRRADGRGRPPADTLAVPKGVLWTLRTGTQWRELPEKYPPYHPVHGRHQQGSRCGQLEEVLRALA
jgi:transposase